MVGPASGDLVRYGDAHAQGLIKDNSPTSVASSSSIWTPRTLPRSAQGSGWSRPPLRPSPQANRLFSPPHFTRFSDRTNLRDSALQSPAKIGSSPTKGRGIFPPSPENLQKQVQQSSQPAVTCPPSMGSQLLEPSKHIIKGKQREGASLNTSNGHPVISTPNSRGSLEGPQRKRFDMSDWQNDLAAIASSDAATPTNSHFPNTRPSAYTTPAPAQYNLDVRYAPPEIPKSMLKPRRSNNALKAISAINLPMSAPQPYRMRQLPPPSRLPVPRSSHVSLTAAANISMASSASPSSSSSDSCNPPSLSSSAAISSKRTVPSLSILINPRGPTQPTLQLSESKSLGKSGTVPNTTASLSNAASLFDQSTAVLRHRHRTLSISESDGGISDEGGETEAYLESPELLLAGKEAYLENGDGAMLSNGQDDEGKEAGRDSLLQNQEMPKSRGGNNNENEASPFLDTPGRKRGTSMPLREINPAFTPPINKSQKNKPFFNSNLDDLVITTSFSSHPAQPTLKSSRTSYPPKTLNFHSSKAGRDTLYASVPASTAGSRPDELFLASILNGHSHAASGSTASKSASAGSGFTASPVGEMPLPKNSSLASATGGAINANPAVTMQSSVQVNRKRNANGAMIVGGNVQPGRGGSKLAANSPTRGMHKRHASSSEGHAAVSTGRRPSVDAVTDEEETVSTSTCTSASLPPLTDSSSATSSLASSHRSGIDKSDSVDGDTPLEEVSFSTTTTTSDTSSILGHVRRTSSTNNKLNLSGAGRVDRQRSPHFRNVRPLQAAFMNSGLLSKKLRSRAERDSGVGLGMTPPFLRRLVSDSARSTPQSNFASPVSHSAGSPVPTLEIANHANGASIAILEPATMPDTPCKRPIFSHSRISAATAGNQLHPLAQASRPYVNRTSSSSSTASDSSSVVNSIPGSVVKVRSAYPANTSSRPSTAISESPTSVGSPCASLAGTSENNKHLKRPGPLRMIRPALFRRRSSGQLYTGPDGSFLPFTERSGGSIRTGTVDWEPITPTRTVTGAQWTGGKQWDLMLKKRSS